MLVTIIIPVYNCEETINRCLDSVCNQIYENIEIIVVNNNTTDRSRIICEEYVKQDNRIKLLDENEQGPGAARNRGLREGTGDIVCFVDADDWIKDNMVQEIVENWNDETELIWFEYNQKQQSVEKNDKMNVIRKIEKKIDDLYCFVIWNKAFDYKTIRKDSIYFPTDRCLTEDTIFCLEYFKAIEKIDFVHDELYVKCDSHLTQTYEGKYVRFLPDWVKTLQDVNLWYQSLDKQIYKQAYENVVCFIINHIIIAMVKLQHPEAKLSYGEKRKILIKMVNDKSLRIDLKMYVPKKGQSKWIPRLIKMKAVFLLQIVLKYRSWKRYRGEKTK